MPTEPKWHGDEKHKTLYDGPYTVAAWSYENICIDPGDKRETVYCWKVDSKIDSTRQAIGGGVDMADVQANGLAAMADAKAADDASPQPISQVAQRDLFAMAALEGLLSDNRCTTGPIETSRDAYLYADAMVAARSAK